MKRVPIWWDHSFRGLFRVGANNSPMKHTPLSLFLVSSLQRGWGYSLCLYVSVCVCVRCLFVSLRQSGRGYSFHLYLWITSFDLLRGVYVFVCVHVCVCACMCVCVCVREREGEGGRERVRDVGCICWCTVHGWACYCCCTVLAFFFSLSFFFVQRAELWYILEVRAW